VHITVQAGSVTVGGGASDGEIMIKDNKGKTTIELDGNGGAIKVNGNAVMPADFVFEPGYSLPEIEEVSSFIKTNKHLPDVPSGQEMKANGVDLNTFSMKLLQKVEELTLYVINQNEEIKRQQQAINDLKKQVK